MSLNSILPFTYDNGRRGRFSPVAQKTTRRNFFAVNNHCLDRCELGTLPNSNCRNKRDRLALATCRTQQARNMAADRSGFVEIAAEEIVLALFVTQWPFGALLSCGFLSRELCVTSAGPCAKLDRPYFIKYGKGAANNTRQVQSASVTPWQRHNCSRDPPGNLSGAPGKTPGPARGFMFCVVEQS